MGAPHRTPTAGPGTPPAPEVAAERYALALAPELTAAAVRSRVGHVNVLLRTSLLGALQMGLDVALNVLVDQAGEIAPFDRALLYVWDEDRERLSLAVARGVADPDGSGLGDGTRLTEWAFRLARPVLVPEAGEREAAAALAAVGAGSAVAVPLFVAGEPRGTLELYAARPHAFSVEDARFLVVLAVQAEALLHRHQDRALLARLATTDPLTGLYNRRRFEEELARELNRAARGRHAVSLLIADVDHFKAYNDRYTHLAGDQALRDVADMLLAEARRGDAVCRYGGEEFAVILPETDEIGALTFARRVAEAVESHRFAGAGGARDGRLTISVGTASSPADGRDRRTLVRAADLALYQAKALGRNRVVQAAELAPGGAPVTAEAAAIDYDLVVRAVNSFGSVGQLLDLLVRLTMEAASARRASALLLDRDGETLRVRSAQGQSVAPGVLATFRIRVGDGVAGYVAATRRPLVTGDVHALAAATPGLRPNGASDYSSPSCLAAPLQAGGRLVGTLHLAEKAAGAPFEAADLYAVLPVAAQVARFLADGLDFERRQRRFVQLAATAIATVVDARSLWFRDHGRRVADLAVAIARELRLPRQDASSLAVAARLHDIGRLAVARDLFVKPGPLTEAEMRIVRTHTTLGAKILEAVPGLSAERAMILSHHERLDGSGYPEGLSGARIPLATRILSVADVYDALVSARPYRPPRTSTEALGEIAGGAGKTFDPRVVTALARVLGRGSGTTAA